LYWEGNCWACRLWLQITNKLRMHGKQMPIPAEMFCKSFWTLYKISEITCLVHLTRLHKKNSCHSAASPNPLLGFTADSDHQSGGRNADVMCSAVKRRASHYLNCPPAPYQTECNLWWALSWICTLALSKWTDGGTLFWVNSWSCRALLHTLQYPGKVSLDLEKARSKLSVPWYLTVFPDPGSINPLTHWGGGAYWPPTF
jgi:hypothetical protein